MDEATIDESKNRMEITIHSIDIKTEDDLKNKKKKKEGENHYKKYKDYCRRKKRSGIKNDNQTML